MAWVRWTRVEKGLPLLLFCCRSRASRGAWWNGLSLRASPQTGVLIRPLGLLPGRIVSAPTNAPGSLPIPTDAPGNHPVGAGLARPAFPGSPRGPRGRLQTTPEAPVGRGAPAPPRLTAPYSGNRRGGRGNGLLHRCSHRLAMTWLDGGRPKAAPTRCALEAFRRGGYHPPAGKTGGRIAAPACGLARNDRPFRQALREGWLRQQCSSRGSRFSPLV